MDNISILLLNIIAILLSPLIATGVTLYFTHKNDKKKDKLALLAKLMTTRLNRSTIEYVDTLNMIDIIFYDSKNVRAELKKLLDAYRSDKPDNNEIDIRNLRLIESMTKHLGYTKMNWEEISKPYAPIWYYDELHKQEKYKCGQLEMANFIKLLTNIPNNTNNKS